MIGMVYNGLHEAVRLTPRDFCSVSTTRQSLPPANNVPNVQRSSQHPHTVSSDY